MAASEAHLGATVGGSPGTATFIRTATPKRDDMRAFLALVWMFHRESRWAKNTVLSEMAAARYYSRFVRGGPAAGWFAEDGEGRTVGFMLGQVQPPWWSTTPIAYEQGFYVMPPHRGTGIGKVLLTAFEEWAAEWKPAYAQVSVTSGVQNDAVAGFLEGAGYRRSGAAFEKEV